MPVEVFKIGKKFCVMEKGRKGTTKGRCHATKQQALKQARAINASLKKAGKI